MSLHTKNMFFTSESVSNGHPDKFCDQISDAVLDECLRQDPTARVACETYVTMGAVIVGGEITTDAVFDASRLVRDLGNEIGYSAPEYGFDVNTAAIFRTIHAQSPDISMGVSREDHELGAGDQGMMFGYACDQTPELMPLPIMLAHRLAMKLAEVRKSRVLPYLGPDGKTQVTVEYVDSRPVRIEHVVIAASHTAAAVSPDGRFTSDEAKHNIIGEVIRPVAGALMDEKTKITVNGTGKFLVSGPQADTGLTGRKIIVDTYGGWALHGGGAFSGKDPSKVDRSAGYMARYIAKNIVAAGLAQECVVQIGYCIGLVEPVSLMVNTYGTGELPEAKLAQLVRKVFPLSPRGIIDHLDLRRPIYLRTAAYGHFGREGFPWERVDAAEELLARAKKV